jgi:D-glycero-alpha-D-manno-heptose-7-phosphate kinase
VPPYSEEQGGFVCNIAINRYATAVLRTGAEVPGAPEEAANHALGALSPGEAALANAASRRMLSPESARHTKLALHSDFPVGAGLGGSSAAGVAALSVLLASQEKTMARGELAELSRRVEVEDLGVPGGRQDHYAAAFGGALALSFHAEGVGVETIPLSAGLRQEIERRFAVVYTGQSRISGNTITAVIDAYRARDVAVLESLNRMRLLARFMADFLRHGAIDDLAAALKEHWQYQRSLHPLISTPQIDFIMQAALESGALGGKALGASGGGCVLFVAQAGDEERLRQRLQQLGQLLAFEVDEGGAIVRSGGTG